MGHHLKKTHTHTINFEERVHQKTCPACSYHLSAPFLNNGRQPLTTLGWPESADEAKSMQRFPLSFLQCLSCTHIYNADFRYEDIPYSKKPNLMYNNGLLWQEHLKQNQQELLEKLPAAPTVIEIGYGDGHFLKAMAQQNPQGSYIGFDPGGSCQDFPKNTSLFHELFLPETHMANYQPDLIILRHVLEHLTNPLAFLQAMDVAATLAGIQPYVFVEVPCIDRVFETQRTVDFFYEHHSHFTTQSFTTMCQQGTGFRPNSTSEAPQVKTGYDDEVIYGLIRLGQSNKAHQINHAAETFFQTANAHRDHLCQQFKTLAQSGQSIAIWGGTGKAACFMNRYQLDAERFPRVVDSDPEKVGTFVPGMGQEIQSPEVLREKPVDTVIITTQWRARDIVLEITTKQLPIQNILLEFEGRLVDYFHDAHPYREQTPFASSEPKSSQKQNPTGMTIPFPTTKQNILKKNALNPRKKDGALNKTP